MSIWVLSYVGPLSLTINKNNPTKKKIKKNTKSLTTTTTKYPISRFNEFRDKILVSL